jgi:hypothetical protein
MKPIVYISSPYSKGDPCINTFAHVQMFNRLLDDGVVVPIAPLVSHFLHTMHPRAYEDWLQYDLELIRVADACLRINASHDKLQYRQTESSGADRECERCLKLGIPVFYDVPSLYDWLGEFPRTVSDV